MTASGVAAAERVVYPFIEEHFPWLPKPQIIEWNNGAGGSQTYATATTIAVPKYSDPWNEGRVDVLIHEVGHVLAFWLGTKGVPVIERFLETFAPSFTHPLIHEVFAEHFARAYVDGYDGRNKPELVGLIPFDAAKMRAFCEQAKDWVANLGQPTPEAKVVTSVPVARGVPQTEGAGDETFQPASTTPERAPEWRGPLPGSNFMPGRDGTLIDRIVLHHMDGTLAGTHAHFTNPTTKVSAHFGVGRDITVQWVSTGDTAYHAGNFDVNMRSIGIEVEDMGRDEYTEAQYLALIQLVKDLATTHGIPLDREHVIGHRQVVTTTCPGTLDVDRVVRDAGGDDMDDQRVREIIQEEVRATIESIKAELGKQAHHTHKTGEPEAA